MHDIGEDGVDMHGEKALLGAVTLSVRSTPRGKLDVISFFGQGRRVPWEGGG